MSPDALIEALSGSVITQPDGVVVYLNAAGKPHRTAGPAIVYPDGNQRWCRNGVYHRTDGPAIVFPTGEQYWIQNGSCHRTDGPAVVCADGSVCWFLNDIRLSEEECNRRIASGEYRDP